MMANESHELSTLVQQERGTRRPATSAVDKASEAFSLRGVKEIKVYIATCGGRKAVKTWLHLEASLLAVFQDRYWAIGDFQNTTRKSAQSATQKM
jgi:hypothetical protein